MGLDLAYFRLVLVKAQVGEVGESRTLEDEQPRIGVAGDARVRGIQDEGFVEGGVLDTTDPSIAGRSEEHTSELQSHSDLVCRLLLEKKKKTVTTSCTPTWRSIISPPSSLYAAPCVRWRSFST